MVKDHAKSNGQTQIATHFERENAEKWNQSKSNDSFSFEFFRVWVYALFYQNTTLFVFRIS